MATKDPLHHKILQAAQDGNVNLLKSLVNDSFQFNDCYYLKSGDTPLHVAAREGNVPVLRFLCEECPTTNPDVGNFDGKRPLHEASQASQVEAVCYLLSKGAEVNSLKRADWTPLMLACTKKGGNALSVVQVLLQNGANPHLRNKDGWTAFHLACREGDVNIISHLLKTQPELWTTVSKNSRTPLHTAALHGHCEVVQLLLRQANPPDQPDSCGTTAFMEAARIGDVKTLELLRQFGASEWKEDMMGRNCLHLSAQAGQVKVIEHLIQQRGFDPNSRTFTGLTPLHFAVRDKQWDAVNCLVRLGADTSVKDNKGREALTGKEEAH